jgi:hypothetical protein
MHCTTSRKVVGSIPDSVIDIFHWHNPSCRTMALGLIQPLSEMSTGLILEGYRRPVCRANNLTTFMCRLSWNLEVSTYWNSQDLHRNCFIPTFRFTQGQTTDWAPLLSPCTASDQINISKYVTDGYQFEVFVRTLTSYSRVYPKYSGLVPPSIQ